MSLAPPANPLAPGFCLDRYELLWPIAEGGMASVWLARLHGKRGFEKLVAVKTILPKFAADPRFQTMFLDEARIAAGIEHTNVTRVLDLGEQDGVLYIAMEWVDGDALGKLQRQLARAGVPLPLPIVLRIIADACAGLHAAHELRDRDGVPIGIVHRDVSPQNILVSGEGIAKIIDFGVAKARDRIAEDTSAGSLKGKIQYMAPEQALGRSVDRRADVWAIGAVLYYFFSGRRVYEAESELATLQLLTSGVPPTPLPASVPPIIVDIIRGTLRHKVEERTANLDIVRRQLEHAMLQLGCMVRPADVGEFIATYARDRAVTRRTTIANALQAADARAALAAEPPSIASSSGLLDVQARPPNSFLSSVVPPPGSARTLARPPAETSSTTLGSAALDAATHPRHRSLGLWFGGVAALGALAGGAALLIVALRRAPPTPVSAGPVAAAHSVAEAPPKVPTSTPSAAPSAAPIEWSESTPSPPGPPASAAAQGAAPPSTASAPAVKPPVAALPAKPPVAARAPAAPKPATKRASKGTDEADDGF